LSTDGSNSNFRFVSMSEVYLFILSRESSMKIPLPWNS
jgi:hypothetical protein